MYGAGVVEIIAGIVVAFCPLVQRLSGSRVAGWDHRQPSQYDPPLWYDIAPRDLGLMMGALTLALLAQAYWDSRAADEKGLR